MIANPWQKICQKCLWFQPQNENYRNGSSGLETVKNDAALNQSVVYVDLSNSELPLTQGKDWEQVKIL